MRSLLSYLFAVDMASHIKVGIDRGRNSRGKQADDHHPSSLVGRNTVRALGLGLVIAAIEMSSPKPSKERDLMAMKAAMFAESIARRRSHRGIIQSASSLGSSGSVSDKQVEPAGHPIVEFAPMRNCLVKRVKTTRV